MKLYKIKEQSKLKYEIKTIGFKIVPQNNTYTDTHVQHTVTSAQLYG